MDLIYRLKSNRKYYEAKEKEEIEYGKLQISIDSIEYGLSTMIGNIQIDQSIYTLKGKCNLDGNLIDTEVEIVVPQIRQMRFFSKRDSWNDPFQDKEGGYLNVIDNNKFYINIWDDVNAFSKRRLISEIDKMAAIGGKFSFGVALSERSDEEVKKYIDQDEIKKGLNEKEEKNPLILNYDSFIIIGFDINKIVILK